MTPFNQIDSQDQPSYISKVELVMERQGVGYPEGSRGAKSSPSASASQPSDSQAFGSTAQSNAMSPFPDTVWLELSPLDAVLPFNFPKQVWGTQYTNSQTRVTIHFTQCMCVGACVCVSVCLPHFLHTSGKRI